MDTDGAAAHLTAVQYDIIGLGPYRTGIRIDALPVFLKRHREGMVHGHETVLLVRPLKQREIHDPHKAECVVVDESHLLPEFEAKRPERRADGPERIGCKEKQVSVLTAHGADEGSHLFFRHKFGK